MHPQGRTLIEDDLRAFAADGLDPRTEEAIEAYLLHHPDAAGRVETYRRAVRAGSATVRLPRAS